MKRAAMVIAAGLAGCFAELEPLPPESFACTADDLTAGGALQCPASHWCSDLQCTPRMACSAAMADNPACAPCGEALFPYPIGDCTSTVLERCQLVVNDQIAAVTCEPLNHTVTSTVPTDPAGCDCVDGTHCVALAEGPDTTGDAYGLFVLPDAGGAVSLPVGQLQITGERQDTRLCARACSGELDCPAGHTCRAAAVVQPALLADPTSTRHTVGVCYPDRLTTLTASAAAQPDPRFCAAQPDCPAPQICQVQAVVIGDHPSVPAGAAWGDEHIALIPRCVTPGGVLKPVGTGCDRQTRCESGVCFNARCPDLCDPSLNEPCGEGRTCRHVKVPRGRPAGNSDIIDHLWLCGS